MKRSSIVVHMSYNDNDGNAADARDSRVENNRRWWTQRTEGYNMSEDSANADAQAAGTSYSRSAHGDVDYRTSRSPSLTSGSKRQRLERSRGKY